MRCYTRKDKKEVCIIAPILFNPEANLLPLSITAVMLCAVIQSLLLEQNLQFIHHARDNQAESLVNSPELKKSASRAL